MFSAAQIYSLNFITMYCPCMPLSPSLITALSTVFHLRILSYLRLTHQLPDPTTTASPVWAPHPLPGFPYHSLSNDCHTHSCCSLPHPLFLPAILFLFHITHSTCSCLLHTLSSCLLYTIPVPIIHTYSLFLSNIHSSCSWLPYPPFPGRPVCILLSSHHHMHIVLLCS